MYSVVNEFICKANSSACLSLALLRYPARIRKRALNHFFGAPSCPPFVFQDFAHRKTTIMSMGF